MKPLRDSLYVALDDLCNYRFNINQPLTMDCVFRNDESELGFVESRTVGKLDSFAQVMGMPWDR